MKNLRKTMLSIVSIAACLSAETFAMQDEREGSPVARTAAGSTSAAASYSVPHLEAGQSYDAWLEARIQSFASSPLFSMLPDEDKPDLLEKDLRPSIANFQASPHIFYNPAMENHPHIREFRCLNAELAILWFEAGSIVGLAKRVIRADPGLADMLTLAEKTEDEYDNKELLVKKKGQRIATIMVQYLSQREEAQRQRQYMKSLRDTWGLKLEEKRTNIGFITGFPAVLSSPYSGTVLASAAEYCRIQLLQPKWREDLRLNELSNLKLDSSEDASFETFRRTIRTYNELVEEEALENIAAYERVLQEEREAKARADAESQGKQRSTENKESVVSTGDVLEMYRGSSSSPSSSSSTYK